MAQIALVTNDPMQLGVSRIAAASARMVQGLLEFQIASAKLTGDLWLSVLDDAAQMDDRPSARSGFDKSLKAAKVRCDRAMQEMRKINDRVIACSFECAGAVLESVADAVPAGSSTTPSVERQPKQAAE